MNWLDDQAEHLRRREDALDMARFIIIGIAFAICVAVVRQIAEIVYG